MLTYSEENAVPRPLALRSKKCLWVCDNGHTVNMSPFDVERGRGCPYCSGRRVLPGFNDVSTTHPEIMHLWDYELNEISPDSVLPGSHLTCWWHCNHGKSHSFQAPVHRIVSGRGCNICAGKVATADNSLATLYPHIAREYSNRNPLPASRVTYGSSRKVWWRCSRDHEFTATVKSRTTGNRGCPYCANKVALPGFNDLASMYPHLASEWDIGNSKKPAEVTSGSGYRATWKCQRGHTWSATVTNRVFHGSGCPHCANSGTSTAELELLDFVQSLLPNTDVWHRCRQIVTPYELDIVIPSLKLAIEYNGLFWHSEKSGKSRDYHVRKRQMCVDAGYRLITIWEDDWRDRRTLVENLLKHKLGVSQTTVYARQTSVVCVSNREAQHFLNSTHLQGFKVGCRHLGLRSPNGDLVAVVSYRIRQHECHIERFATVGSVPGSFTRLLKHLSDKLTSYPHVDTLVSYADYDLSCGDVYVKAGFQRVGDTPANYWYVGDDATRRHRSNYDKAAFKKKRFLVYRDGLSESELAELNGLYRVYGSGSGRYELKVGNCDTVVPRT